MRKYSKLLTDVDKIIQDDFRDKFNRELDPNRIKWEPLKGATIDRKGHNRILIEKDVMLKSLNVMRTGYTVLWSLSPDYSIYHQTGTRHMAKRQLIPDNSNQLPNRRIAKKIHNNFVKFYRKEFGIV